MEESVRASQPRLKVVVRRLPARLPESVFFESVKEWANEESTNWRAYYPGKQRQKVGPSRQEGGKLDTMTRAYIQFNTHETLMEFFRGFNGHVFVDRQGKEDRAVVEYAPYQRIPKDPRKDSRQGKLHETPDFLSFVEKLKNGEPNVSLQQQAEQPLDQSKATPLIEYLRQKSSKPKRSKKEKQKADNAVGGSNLPKINNTSNANNGLTASASARPDASSSQNTKPVPTNNQVKPKRRPRGRGRGQAVSTLPPQQNGPGNDLPTANQHIESNGGSVEQPYEDRKSERPQRQGRGRGRAEGRRIRRGRGGDGPVWGGTLQSNTS